jgi:hypothetical protein
MHGEPVSNSHTGVSIFVNLALHIIGQVSNVKLYERPVDEANPFDLLVYWFEYDAGRLSQITVVVVAVLMIVGMFKWVFR